jgi:hypothetical protein
MGQIYRYSMAWYIYGNHDQIGEIMKMTLNDNAESTVGLFTFF